MSAYVLPLVRKRQLTRNRNRRPVRRLSSVPRLFCRSTRGAGSPPAPTSLARGDQPARTCRLSGGEPAARPALGPAAAHRHGRIQARRDGVQQPLVELVEEIPGAAHVVRRRPRRTAAIVVTADRRPASCPGGSCRITRGCSGGAADGAVEHLVPDNVSGGPPAGGPPEGGVRGMRTRSRGPAARSPRRWRRP